MIFNAQVMDRVAIAVDVTKHNPPYSSYGYVIDADGMVYGLTNRFTHGAILSVLYPERFKEWHELKPEDDYNKGYDEDVPVITPDTYTDDILSKVFGYQRFESWLTMNDYHNTVRISLSTMIAEYAVSKAEAACTPAQLEAFRKTMIACGADLKTQVQMDAKETSFKEALKVMAMPREQITEYFYGSGRVA